MKPHRATTVLVFGILSLVVCAPLGIAAWIMGNKDLRDMDHGLMDPTGRETTNAGRICGIIGSIFLLLGILMMIAWFAIAGTVFVSALKDAELHKQQPAPEYSPAPLPDPAR